MRQFTEALESFQLDCKILQIMFFFRGGVHSVQEYAICDNTTINTPDNIKVLLRKIGTLGWSEIPINEITLKEYISKYSSKQYGNRIYILVDASSTKWRFDQNEFKEKQLYAEKLGVFARSTRSTEDHLIFYYNLDE